MLNFVFQHTQSIFFRLSSVDQELISLATVCLNERYYPVNCKLYINRLTADRTIPAETDSGSYSTRSKLLIKQIDGATRIVSLFAQLQVVVYALSTQHQRVD